MSDDTPALQVYQTGEVTVLGFGGQEILEQVNIADCREQITELVRQTGCKTLAFDLTGVKLIPSGMLGLLASLRDLGVDVQIFNPSDDVREVLEITKLDEVITVRHVDVEKEKERDS
ncbi:MAG TPA: anti-sigma factor antagonist [Planctomycetaceae bacterium]|nr:anti-sigma factor antagonist [Planctomycetaceae bacterium]